ncbi:hypothetical protein [Pyxidicoccus xibeiensis]|uniref:hypothetical protein n=1 Tax=Pyxidicoccus xibeiensis TaxID=2906759 RepID=UPI0020A79E89|nr:hypothetical protein [Pyxidicoccus xibeiensis]MCP3144569.1 hypothetical protein [Pyxidicoccus xibeiensis]
MPLFLMIVGAIAVLGCGLCVYGAGVWRRRERWWAEAPLTPIAAASNEQLIRVTGQAVSSGQVGPLPGAHAAALWRVDVVETNNRSSYSNKSYHHVRFSEGGLAIADGSGRTAMLETPSTHLLLGAQPEVAKLRASGAPTPELEAVCRQLGVSLHPDMEGWSAEARERVIAPGTIVHAVGRAHVYAKAVWLRETDGALESCFVVQHPQAVFAPRRKLIVAGAILFVTGLVLIRLGVLRQWGL